MESDYVIQITCNQLLPSSFFEQCMFNGKWGLAKNIHRVGSSPLSRNAWHWTLKQMGYTWCHCCQLRTENWGYNSHSSPKLDNRKLEKACLVWRVCWFLLQQLDGRVRMWRKQHESMDPSCLVSVVQAASGAVMVWRIFSWCTLGPLVPIEHRLDTTTYRSIVADHVHHFMTTVYLSCDVTSSRITCHVTELKSSQTGLMS